MNRLYEIAVEINRIYPALTIQKAFSYLTLSFAATTNYWAASTENDALKEIYGMPEFEQLKPNFEADMKSDTALVDNRPHNQFIGVNRHKLAKRNGTIPGAINIPENWMTKNGGGVFRPSAQLASLYKSAGAGAKGKQINFCNTGHWASLGWFVSHV